MDLRNLLKPELVTLDLKGKNKEEIISELVDLAARSGKVLNKEEAVLSVFERENRMSTGMKHASRFLTAKRPQCTSSSHVSEYPKRKSISMPSTAKAAEFSS